MGDWDKRHRRSLMARRGERGRALQPISGCLDPVSRRLPAVANCLRPLSLGAAMLKLVEEA